MYIFYVINNKYEMLKNRIRTLFYKIRWFFCLKADKKTLIKKNFRVNPMLGYNKNGLKIRLGYHVNIEPNVTIQNSGKVTIGDWSSLGERTIIGTSEEVNIGFAVIIASGVSIRDNDHKYDDLTKTISSQGIVSSKVTICDDVWIGANAVITSGVTIGKGAIIGANAVVTHDVPAGCIYGGVPARLIKKRGTDDEIEKYVSEKQY